MNEDGLDGVLVMSADNGVVLRTYFGHINPRRWMIVENGAGIGTTAGQVSK